MKVFLTCALLLGTIGVIAAQSNVERVQEEEEGASPDHININDLPPYLRELIKNMKGEAPEVTFSPENMVGGCSAGFPGVPGKNGMPGRNGLNGLQGVKGDTGVMGPEGPAGPAGLDGPMGPAGAIGQPGPIGPIGRAGSPGMRGLPGMNGVPGATGKDGMDGKDGKDGKNGKDRKHLWKQCAWMEESDEDSGVIKMCNFTKIHQSSWLKVSFSGNLRVAGCSNCCGRWFFTFNGQECGSPVPIDAAIYMVGPASANPLRPRHIEGFCGNIPKGKVNIALSVGQCSGFGVANAFTGWGSASRIIVEEVQAPQE